MNLFMNELPKENSTNDIPVEPPCVMNCTGTYHGTTCGSSCLGGCQGQACYTECTGGCYDRTCASSCRDFCGEFIVGKAAAM